MLSILKWYCCTIPDTTVTWNWEGRSLQLPQCFHYAYSVRLNVNHNEIQRDKTRHQNSDVKD